MTERMIHQFAEPDEQGIELLRMAMGSFLCQQEPITEY